MSQAVYIVAEIGNTHEGSLGLAKCFIKAAASCGVNAVKFQTHIFEHESLDNAPTPPYFKDESRRDYFRRTAFNLEQYKVLKTYSTECGVEFFSSPFSLEAVDILEEVGVARYKIPSGEVTNLPLLARIAATKKPVILSSGMSSWYELDAAVEELRSAGCSDLTILQCTSEYPCPPEHSGLHVVTEMIQRYPFAQIGYSDHTLGSAIPIAAVCLGARFVEKHFTLSQGMYGSDAKNATEPADFAALVRDIRQVELGLKSRVDKDSKALELSNMKEIFEKSIVLSAPLREGHRLTLGDLRYKKPGNGISASRFRELIGRRLKADFPEDHMLSENDFHL